MATATDTNINNDNNVLRIILRNVYFWFSGYKNHPINLFVQIYEIISELRMHCRVFSMKIHNDQCKALRWHLQSFALALAKLCVGTCKALRWLMQCFALDNTLRCVSQHTALRRPIHSGALANTLRCVCRWAKLDLCRLPMQEIRAVSWQVVRKKRADRKVCPEIYS